MRFRRGNPNLTSAISERRRQSAEVTSQLTGVSVMHGSKVAVGEHEYGEQSYGQRRTTIPRAVRAKLGLTAGNLIAFENQG